jgi:hypothetical protein
MSPKSADMPIATRLDRSRKGLGSGCGVSETATARYWTAMERHKLYISEHGEDMQVRDWRWSL